MLLHRKDQKIMAYGGSSYTRAYADDKFDVTFKGDVFHSTVRTTSCKILSHGTKCLACSQYRSQLRSLHSLWSHKKTISAKNGNNRSVGRGGGGLRGRTKVV